MDGCWFLEMEWEGKKRGFGVEEGEVWVFDCFPLNSGLFHMTLRIFLIKDFETSKRNNTAHRLSSKSLALLTVQPNDNLIRY